MEKLESLHAKSFYETCANEEKFCLRHMYGIMTYALNVADSPLPSCSMSSFDAVSELLGLPLDPCEPCELFLDGPSSPGERESDVPPEFGPESERLKNFVPGDCGVPSRESLSLDSRLEMIGCMRLPGISFSGVCGSVGHSWSNT